ncbi:hypothetical protein L596_006457 [Steinernema carpocapsae]|uniref:Uncharacterized protein n=1 Tax=Steinernema carpocapsae TaxID=34508 RepID=A0A4U8VAE4_STECR|nr:hypothetical protein L596_006457 [Steinernema carpocapsae]
MEGAVDGMSVHREDESMSPLEPLDPHRLRDMVVDQHSMAAGGHLQRMQSMQCFNWSPTAIPALLQAAGQSPIRGPSSGSNNSGSSPAAQRRRLSSGSDSHSMPAQMCQPTAFNEQQQRAQQQLNFAQSQNEIHSPNGRGPQSQMPPQTPLSMSGGMIPGQSPLGSPHAQHLPPVQSPFNRNTPGPSMTPSSPFGSGMQQQMQQVFLNGSSKRPDPRLLIKDARTDIALFKRRSSGALSIPTSPYIFDRSKILAKNMKRPTLVIGGMHMGPLSQQQPQTPGGLNQIPSNSVNMSPSANPALYSNSQGPRNVPYPNPAAQAQSHTAYPFPPNASQVPGAQQMSHQQWMNSQQQMQQHYVGQPRMLGNPAGQRVTVQRVPYPSGYNNPTAMTQAQPGYPRPARLSYPSGNTAAPAQQQPGSAQPSQRTPPSAVTSSPIVYPLQIQAAKEQQAAQQQAQQQQQQQNAFSLQTPPVPQTPQTPGAGGFPNALGYPAQAQVPQPTPRTPQTPQLRPSLMSAVSQPPQQHITSPHNNSNWVFEYCEKSPIQLRKNEPAKPRPVAGRMKHSRFKRGSDSAKNEWTDAGSPSAPAPSMSAPFGCAESGGRLGEKCAIASRGKKEEVRVAVDARRPRQGIKGSTDIGQVHHPSAAAPLPSCMLDYASLQEGDVARE